MRFTAAITPISIALLVALIVPIKAGADTKLTQVKSGPNEFVTTAQVIHGAASGLAGAGQNMSVQSDLRFSLSPQGAVAANTIAQRTDALTLTSNSSGAAMAALRPVLRSSYVWDRRVVFAKPRKLIPPRTVAMRKIGSIVTASAAIKIKSKAKTKRGRAPARLVATINLTTQRMSVKIDGVVRETWKISSGKRGFFTPRGTYTPYRMHTMWYSRKYNNAKMPHSVFYSGGFAVHGTYAASRLGSPASHGCTRLSLKNARKFFNLVKKYGRSATRVTIIGSTPRARSYARRSPAKKSHRHARRPDAAYRAAYGQTRPARRRSYARRTHYVPAPQPKGLFAIIFQ